MKNINALLKLDYQLIKPYWKWVLMFLGMAIFFGILNQMGEVFILMIVIFLPFVLAFPFEMTDKSNLNVLFGTLPTTRQSVLSARYVFAVLSLVIGIIIAFAGSVIITFGFNNYFSIANQLMMLCLGIGIFAILLGWQNIFFFQKGYTKGRFFAWIPMILLFILLNISSLLSLFRVETDFSFESIMEALFSNPLITSLVSLVVAIVALGTSYIISKRIYLKKDF